MKMRLSLIVAAGARDGKPAGRPNAPSRASRFRFPVLALSAFHISTPPQFKPGTPKNTIKNEKTRINFQKSDFNPSLRCLVMENAENNLPLGEVAIIRDRQSWLAPGGKRAKVYGMASYTGQIVASDDDFQAWEAECLITVSSGQPGQ